jgi:hypothetical protein
MVRPTTWANFPILDYYFLWAFLITEEAQMLGIFSTGKSYLAVLTEDWLGLLFQLIWSSLPINWN